VDDADTDDCPAGCDDADQDGFPDQACGGSDCDDANDRVHPNAVESCNDGLDNNCDSRVDDEDTTACPPGCADADGDGYPDQACGGTDCDDAVAEVNPGAMETCFDQTDNNCDGLTDAEDHLSCPHGCLDGDGDGYVAFACGGADCDDTAPDIHPQATEQCDDGVDNNCDGLIDDEDAISCPPCPDLDGDGHTDVTCGGDDCADSDPQIHPGAAEVCDDGADNNCNGLTDMADTSVCVCSPGSTLLTCGTSDIGECHLGTQMCVDYQWGPCEGAVYPTAELCDGRDQNCDGVLDDGTFLPDDYTTLEWIPSGWFGLPEGFLVAWNGTLAMWDSVNSVVFAVADLGATWNAISPNGTLPPTTSVDSVLVLPAGVFPGVSDSLWVMAGPTAYAFDSSVGTWQSQPISGIFGTNGLDSITLMYANDIPGVAEPVVLFSYGGQVYYWLQSTGISAPMTAAQAFCPPDTTGICPPTVDSLGRSPGTPPAVVVQSGSWTYTSGFLVGANGIYYQWSRFHMSGVSCAH